MRKLLVITALASLVFVPGANGKVHRSPIVQSPTGICMIRAGGGIGCFGEAVPAGMLDGYIWIRRGGNAHLAESGGTLAPVSARPRKLRRGDRWVKRGVTCHLKRGLKCWNRAGHGFKLTRRHYRVW